MMILSLHNDGSGTHVIATNSETGCVTHLHTMTDATVFASLCDTMNESMYHTSDIDFPEDVTNDETVIDICRALRG